jgi:hypothetical protein
MVDWFAGGLAGGSVFSYSKDKPQETIAALQKLSEDFEMQRHHRIIEMLEDKVDALKNAVLFFVTIGFYVCLETKDKVLTASYIVATVWLVYYLYVKDQEIHSLKSAEFTCKRVECPK